MSRHAALRDHVVCSAAFRAEWLLLDCGWAARRLAHYIRDCAPRGPWALRAPRRLFCKAGPTKRLMRRRVYEAAAFLVSHDQMWRRGPGKHRFYAHEQHRAERVALLAGGEPGAEIALARAAFPDAHVIAFDLDARAVAAAQSAGADLAVRLDVGSLRFGGPHLAPPELTTRYRFINLDFCGLVTSDGVAQAIERAGHMTNTLATWFSYGHEQELGQLTARADFLASEAPEAFRELPKTARDRLLHIWHITKFANPNPYTVGRVRLEPQKVWLYRDRRMPMMCVLWSVDPNGLEPTIPCEHVSITEDDFRQMVLEEAHALGPETACAWNSVTRAQLAAWRAVDTRRRRSEAR